ncbi:hypothetical protein [Micromonospora sp. WMMD710]|uniref:hypothetical protein n=1 Tax=Micromonospora sp. WMMD710 TaxID=3016085 RepID=UPI0024165BBE|nr:hypothetical protein [Micromonospora sp. WMMD710]MDG4761492.1 hypothetical protein [Micromonospora sp. WMMD710]
MAKAFNAGFPRIHDRLALTVYLATVQVEASEQLIDVDPARLTERFLSWARARA